MSICLKSDQVTNLDYFIAKFYKIWVIDKIFSDGNQKQRKA
jgi:hypothetical protein